MNKVNFLILSVLISTNLSAQTKSSSSENIEFEANKYESAAVQYYNESLNLSLSEV